MIRINLLPAEIRVAEVRKQLAIICGILGGVLVLSLVGFWGSRRVKISRLETQLVEAKAELKKYQEIVDKVTALEKTRNQLRSRRDVIKQLLRGRLTYPKFFDDFMTILPEDIWLTSIATSPGQESGSLAVRISASSLSNFAIVNWMTALQKSPFSSAVQLGTVSAAATQSGRPSLLTFTINFQYLRKDG